MTSLRTWLLVCALAACGSPAVTPASDVADATGDVADAADAADDTVQLPQPVINSVAYADPRFGSGGYGFAFGSAFPGASAPNGMMRVGPDTSGPYGTIGFLHFSGYWGGDDTIQAFSHMHLHGTGSTDFGTLGIMPTTEFDPTKLHASDYAATFQKVKERASAGEYSVVLDNGIFAHFTATAHTSLDAFLFPAGTGSVLIDLSHGLSKVEDSTVTLDALKHELTGSIRTSGGMSGGYTLFFVIRAPALSKWQLWANGLAVDVKNASASGKEVAVSVGIECTNGVVWLCGAGFQVGLSLVSVEGAKANLASEIPDPESLETTTAWRSRLQSLTVYGGSDDQRKLFYSSLHHLFMMPGQYSDADGSYVYAGKTQKAAGFRFLTDISGWDIYRSAFPLYTLIAPDLALDMVKSMHAMAKITGNFPKWPLAASDAGSMIGAAADVIIAEAYVKGITQFDSADVYKRLRDAALLKNLPSGEGRGGRDDFDDYAANGFVHVGHGSAVSLTCELNQDDFALANFAQALGMADDATVLMARSHGYQKLYDPATGFLRGRDDDGKITNPNFKPEMFDNSEEFVEADAYQSQFCAQWDADGMTQMWGGKDKLVAALEDLFEKSKVEREQAVADAKADLTSDGNVLAMNLPPRYYFGGNEPDIHYPWLFAQLGRPDLTQKWVPWAMATYFHNGVDGLPGNDDGGTMTAWYIWGALGLYPVPGSDRYLIGSPQFPQVDIRIKDGVFAVIAHDVSAQNLYVQSATLNGQPLSTPIIHHADLNAGGSLVLQMGPTPSQWGRQ
jgi:predicted alpha-1,2-mannosidase